MSETSIVLADATDAQMLRNISVIAFKSDFEKYGSYPPGIESLEWHLSRIEEGHYYKIKYNNDLAGGICLIPKDAKHIEIKYFFISTKFQNKKIGSKVIKLIENQYKHITKWSLVTPYKEYRNHYFYEKLGYIKSGEYCPNSNSEFKVFEYIKIRS